MRKGLLAGNWKMNKTRKEASDFIEDVLELCEKQKASGEIDLDLVLGVPYTLLESCERLAKHSAVKISSQNVHFEDKGAFTGEISPVMLKDLGISYAIIGHSERRQYYNESNLDLSKKVKALQNHSITPIFCVGESLEEREAEKTTEVLEKQVVEGLSGISDLKDLVIAYEPVWAIGTGKTATPEMAEEAHKFIRSVIERLYGKEASDKVRILYGGSMKPENIKELTEKENIDGGLIGGASLEAESFWSLYQKFSRK